MARVIAAMFVLAALIGAGFYVASTDTPIVSSLTQGAAGLLAEAPGATPGKTPSSYNPEVTENKADALKKDDTNNTSTSGNSNSNSNSNSHNNSTNVSTINTSGATSGIPATTIQTVQTATVTTVQAFEVGERTLVDTVSEVKQPSTPAPSPTPPATMEGKKQDNIQNQDKPKERLQEIGNSLRQLQQQVRRVETKVRTTISEEVEQAIQKAASGPTSEPVRAFNPSDRAKRLEELKRAVSEKQDQISEDVRSTLASGAVDEGKISNLQPVLKSSLAEIELLIKSETGTEVDLSPSARNVGTIVSENSSELNDARDDLTARGGLDLYKDTDQDGVSDYDEKHIYGTDPLNAFTVGSSLTDGERILLGFDPFSKSTAHVPVESPKTSGEVVDGIFEVHSININLIPLTASTSPAAASSTEAVPVFREEAVITGRALPNSFVTIYVFSTPVVVTVKADLSGAWSYTLNTELPDGSHELYVATVDAGGKIIAKSPAVPFVKEAQAAAFTPLLIAAPAEVSPLDVLQSNLIVVVVALLLVFAVAVVTILSARRAPPPPAVS